MTTIHTLQEERKKTLIEMLDDPYNGLKVTSNTNKSRNNILAQVEESMRLAYEAGQKEQYEKERSSEKAQNPRLYNAGFRAAVEKIKSQVPFLTKCNCESHESAEEGETCQARTAEVRSQIFQALSSIEQE